MHGLLSNFVSGASRMGETRLAVGGEAAANDGEGDVTTRYDAKSREEFEPNQTATPTP